jgi:hypothetical protein
MSNKVSDNSKILKITGMEKESIASIFDGLAIELKGVLNRSKISQINYTLNAEMDKISRSRISLKKASPKEKIEYFMV